MPGCKGGSQFGLSEGLVCVWAAVMGLAAFGAGGAPRSAASQAAESGDGVCLKCHAPIQRLLAKKNRHAAVEMGCSSCHVNHRDPAAAKSKAPRYLTAEQPELCLACHDAKDEKTAKAHLGQPFEKAACSGCHDPHASDAAKLIPEHSHPPFEARQCDGCHNAPGADRKVSLTAATASQLCFSCHDELKKRVEQARSKHTLLVSDSNSCADCHNPHASRREHFLKKPEGVLCGGCHAEVGTGKKHVHSPVQVSCVLCHDPHASNASRNLHAAGNDLCLACHGPAGARIVEAKEPVSLFDGRVKLAPGIFPDLKYLELTGDGKRGHPLARHPVSVEAGGGNAAITCTTCHLPHAADGNRQLLVTEKADSSQLCVRCHK